MEGSRPPCPPWLRPWLGMSKFSSSTGVPARLPADSQPAAIFPQPSGPFLRAAAGFLHPSGLLRPAAPDCSICRLLQLNPNDLLATAPTKQRLERSYKGRPLDRLPPELLLRILRDLSLQDLSRIARCSKTLRKLAAEARARPRGAELNLRPLWAAIDDSMLISQFGDQASIRVSRLDLSWCGPFDQVSLAGNKVASSLFP